MDSTKIRALVIIVAAFCFALYLGIAAATAQLEALGWVAGSLFLIVCLGLGKNIWVLIPATLGMQGGLNIIPGSPAPWQLMTAVAATFTFLRFLTRKQRLNFRWTAMETVVLLIALTVLQAFVRNPAGVALLGGNVFGGKPYFIFAIAFLAYLVISTADANFNVWRWAVIAFAAFWAIDGTINLLSAFFPKFAATIIYYYSNVSLQAVDSVGYESDIEKVRITQFGQIGACLGLIACSFWRPIGALDFTKPWRAVIALSGVVATVLSGFRSGAALLFINFTLGSIIRRKPLDAIAVSFMALIAAAIVIVAVPSTELPYSVQRVFTVIPGYAREDIARDAKASNDFRFEMWTLALTTDRFIKNKILGDGFQFSASEYQAREALRLGDYRLTGGLSTIDMFMITGSYHGFHVETIRYTGIIGLIVATAALVVFAVFAYRCIKAYRDQPGWGQVIFICMPFLIYPLWYWLVFGEYKGQFPVLIATAGLIKLLHTIRTRELADLHVTLLPNPSERPQQSIAANTLRFPGR